MQLTDLELDREEEKLLGQRSILEKRGAELQRLLVRSNDDVKRLEWETENAEIQTEKQTIEKQLAWVQTQRASLTVRSPVNGSVEAWESAQKLVGKQVRRGETLLDVVDETKGWRIRAEIPQTRLDHVLYALQDQSSLPVSVTLISFPQHLIHGQVTSLGPTTAAGHDGLPVGWTDVQVAAADLPMKQAGAAATVAIRCGRRPLGYIVFQDFIRASWGWWKLWIG